MRSLARVVDRIQSVFVVAAAIVLGLLPLLTFYDVIMRYFFHAPTIWVSEISLYMLQFLVFSTLGALLMHGEHVRVTFWIEGLGGASRRRAEAFALALVLPLAGVLVWQGYLYAAHAYRREMESPTLLQVPLWIPYSFIPLGGFLLILGVLAKIIVVLEGGPLPHHDHADGGERP